MNISKISRTKGQIQSVTIFTDSVEEWKFKLHIGGVNVSGWVDMPVLMEMHTEANKVVPNIPTPSCGYGWTEWWIDAENSLIEFIKSL